MPNTFVLIDCSYPINTRNQKIIESIHKEFKDSHIYVITWDRENDCVEIPNNYFVYKRQARLGNAVEKLKGMKGFKKFIGSILNKLNPSVIIASHWSNLILTANFKKTNQKLIYENLDIPTGSWPIRFVSSFLEKIALKKTDLIIHASRFFQPLYSPSIQQIVLENKPTFEPNYRGQTSNKKLTIAYIGSVRYKEILTNLIDAIKDNENVILYIHGSGEDYKVLKDYAFSYKNIIFTGRYSYDKIVSLYHGADLIWAAYPNKDYNVVYAISNKFHESLFVGVPGIFSSNTKLGEYVEENKLGFTVDPYSVESIKDLISLNLDNHENYNTILDSMRKYRLTQKSWDEDFKQMLNYIN